jgi:uncharacterized protein with PIN domain
MKTINTSFSRRRFISVLAATTAISLVATNSLPVFGHEAKCPYCNLDIVQDTAEQDNEVVLKYGRKRIEYRCVFCALSEAQTEYKNDLSILAPSEIKGKPIVITRKDGNWSVGPANAVFVAEKVNHKQCHVAYRAFSNRAAFDEHVKQHKDLLGDAKPLALADVLKLAR